MKKKEQNFTAKYLELEHLVAWFEKDAIDLEAAVEKLEQGAILVKELKQHLNTVEHSIKELTK